MRFIKNIFHWHQSHPRLAVGFHLAATAFLLGFALVSQYFFGQLPCELCLWQRAPYAVIGALALLALFVKPKWTPLFLGGFAALYAVETGIAFYHVGVQAGWWVSGCGFQPTADDIKALYEQIKNAPVVRCNEVTWRFLSLSMAEWNVLIAGGFTVMSAAQAWVQLVWWTKTPRE